MYPQHSYESLTKLNKLDLIQIAKEIGLKNTQNKKKKEIIDIILKFEDTSEKYTPVHINDTIYNKIYHISDIHIRPLKRHGEYNEVFNNLYSFLEKDTELCGGNNIIAITGDIIHEKDALKPETILICRNFVKKISAYGTVVIIAGNHDMLENNPDRIDNLTAIFDDLNINYLVHSGAYIFGNIILTVSSLVDKKFIKKNQVINLNNLPVVALYHGTINGSVNDFGYVLENTTQCLASKRFRKISDFDDYDMVLLGDIHKHQYLKPHIAYSGSLIQQNFGENIREHGVLIWDILSKKSKFVPIRNRYGFINIHVINKEWKLPNDIPEKPFVRLLLKNTDDDFSEVIKNILEQKFNLQSFVTKQITEEMDNKNELPEEITNHQDDIDILNNEMDIKKFDENKKKDILEIHDRLKSQCDVSEYNMNNQNWKILRISFKNVFIFGENKTNVIDFTTLNGIITIVGPNAIGKSNIINIIIFLLYGSNVDFKVPHILNKYQNEYFIDCELLFGAKKIKIKKTGKKRKGNKLNHSFSCYIHEEDKWIKQDKENNKGTSKLIKSMLGSIEQFLLTNVYSNSSLRTILTLTNSEKHKALSKLFCLDIYENLEKLAKKDVIEIKKQYLFLEGEKKGLLYNFGDNDISNTKKQINDFEVNLKKDQQELKNITNKNAFIKKEKENINIKINTLISKIKHTEHMGDKNFYKIKEDINFYKLKYPDILSKTNQDLEKLKSTFYNLQGSLVQLEEIPDISENVAIEQKKLLIKIINNHKDEINFFHKEQEKIQNTLNQLYKNITTFNTFNTGDTDTNIENEYNFDNTELQEKLKELQVLDKIYNHNTKTSQELENELIFFKTELYGFNKDSNDITTLPINYNNSENSLLIEELSQQIFFNDKQLDKYKKLLGQIYNNFKDGSIKESINESIDIKESIDEREDTFKKQIGNLHQQLQKLNNVPDISIFFPNGQITSDIIEKEIDKISENINFLDNKDIQKHINYIHGLDLQDGENISVDRLTLIKILETLSLINKNINNSNFLAINNKLTKLQEYREILKQNINIEENNSQIQKEIEKIHYLFYSGNIQIINSICENLNGKINLYNKYKYSYQCGIYDKYSSTKNIIKYKKLKKIKKEYDNYLQKKQKNKEIIYECDNNKNKLEELKKRILEKQYIIHNVNNKISFFDRIINNIHIHENNIVILNDMKSFKQNIKEQEIRNTYKKLLDLLEDEQKYESIKNENIKIQTMIDKYNEMTIKLTNELSLTMNSFVNIKSNISSLTKDISIKVKKLKELCDIKEKSNNLNSQINEYKKDLSLYSDYIGLVNKNNIPVKLIHKKNSYIQDHINIFLENLTKFTISINIDDKNGINFSANKNDLILDINQLSGYETFILNIALKSALNKYSFISKSTLFILDEGLDVVDKNNFKKLDMLMKLLMRHYKHILLISHMPKVKDLQHHEINIHNNRRSSFII